MPLSIPSVGLSTASRALGVNLFLKLLDSGNPFLARGPQVERKKVALCQNRWTATARCLIHIVPSVLSLTIVILNLKGYYIGDELAGPSGYDSQKLGALQFAAKLHELTIHASIAAMVLSYLRYELALGKGLPFGAMLAGNQFTDLSFLWSIELWGALSSWRVPHTWIRRTVMAAILILATLIAAAAGPVSAIAIIPRLGLWPACGTRFWLNSSNAALWPAEVNASHFDPAQCTQADTEPDFGCPDGGLQSIKAFSTTLRRRGWDWVPARSLTVYGRHGTRSMNITLKLGRNTDRVTTAFVPPLAAVDAFTEASTWWPSAARYAFKRGGPRYWLARKAYIEASATAPVTRVRCSSLMSTTGGPGQSIYFPLLNPLEDVLTSTSYTDDQIWNDAAMEISSGRELSKVFWSPLPNTDFKNSTMGAVVVLPFEPNASAITYTTCNVDARWAATRIWTFNFENTFGLPEGLPDVRNPLGRYDVDWSWPHISADIEWVNYMSRKMSQANETVDAFAAIAADAGITGTPDPTHPWAIESILAMMFTDALARVGSNATLQGELKGRGKPRLADWEDGPWVDEFMQFGDAYAIDAPANAEWYSSRLSVSVVGYAYSSDGATSKLACSILLFHVLLAFIHTIYSLKSGLSSSSWDSVAELVALAMNSTPSDALRNTCAGIELPSTMGLPVKIVESAQAEEHLEMLVEVPRDEETDTLELLNTGKVVHRSVTVNKEYGVPKG